MTAPLGFRFKVHAGPCGVAEVAARLRQPDGYGFDVSGGTENVYLSAFIDPDRYQAVGGPASYVAELLRNVLGWRPLVTVFDVLDKGAS
jgi:hypothetical protein